MKLVIYGRLPGANEYINACRTNPHVAAKMKAEAEQEIGFEILNQLGNKPIKGKARISFWWYEPNRKRDLDNVSFAKKFILDALVKEGVINGDGWNYVVGLEDNFGIDDIEPRIEVEIKEVGE